MRTVRCIVWEGVYPSMHWAGGVYPSMHPGGVSAQGVSSTHPLPPVDRMTDACENITLPQLRCGR